MNIEKQNYAMFFLGLLEGDGSIQVNHWKKRCLQYRFVIKLAYSDANYAMCAKLRDNLGVMNVHVRKNNIVMVEDHRDKIPILMRIIEHYGLLLAHRRKQYAFFRYCFQHRCTYSEYAHIKALNDTWSGFDKVNPASSAVVLSAPHWPHWLCGFTEAEGCFCIRANGNLSFSIAQKNGSEVMHAIKTFFNATNKVRQTTRVHSIEIYATAVLTPLVEFYGSDSVVGLLGQKRLQWLVFKAALQNKKAQRLVS